ncbi:hypothetical protein [Methanobacterium oryzae]|uniref:hypothetical protein n=1 Tax=Methanobacterium oryzae TaxID=69540 RepID=UPI003D24389A
MSEWLNNTNPIWKDAIKPCLILKFCPYGKLVEEFPISNDEKSCKIFEHDCPVFYHAEPFTEPSKDDETIQEEYHLFLAELTNYMKDRIKT